VKTSNITKKDYLNGRRELLLYQFTRKAIKLTVVIVVGW
jgi:hypothetical protein